VKNITSKILQQNVKKLNTFSSAEKSVKTSVIVLRLTLSCYEWDQTWLESSAIQVVTYSHDFDASRSWLISSEIDL